LIVRHPYKAGKDKATKEALEQALQGLEGVSMTRRDDPKLSALKDDIHRALSNLRKRTRPLD
jgi:hypothetical protein